MRTVLEILSVLPETKEQVDSLVQEFETELEMNEGKDFYTEKLYKDRISLLADNKTGLFRKLTDTVNRHIVLLSKNYPKTQLEEIGVSVIYGCNYNYNDNPEWVIRKNEIKELELKMRTALSAMHNGKTEFIDEDTGDIIPPAKKNTNTKPTIKI